MQNVNPWVLNPQDSTKEDDDPFKREIFKGKRSFSIISTDHKITLRYAYCKMKR